MAMQRKDKLMKRYILIAAVAALSVVAVAAAFASHGGSKDAIVAGSQDLKDGRHFGLIRSVDLKSSPETMVFDAADQLTGEEANRAAAAHGDEVPVPNDVYKVNDDPTLRTLSIAADAEILLMDWDRCCEPIRAGRDQLAAADVTHAWGYWVTLQDGVVVKIEEQFHP
jgi:hypothetical protein